MNARADDANTFFFTGRILSARLDVPVTVVVRKDDAPTGESILKASRVLVNWRAIRHAFRKFRTFQGLPNHYTTRLPLTVKRSANGYATKADGTFGE